MPSYNKIRPLSFRIAPEVTELNHNFYTLAFPRKWEVELKRLQGEYINRPPDRRKLPIRSLNDVVYALVPDLISIARYTDVDKRIDVTAGYRWLYSTRPIDTEAIFLLVYNWIDIAFAKAPQESRQRVLDTLESEELVWNLENINLADWKTNPNGTARAGNADSFTLLPDWIASQISKTSVSLRYGPEKLRFRRATLSQGSRGAELISWPPIEVIDDEHQKWFYSVVITFTVQTIPFQSYPVIYCDFSVRRWVSTPDARLGGGKTTVQLLTEVPWLKGEQQSSSFQAASVYWKRISTDKNSPKFQLQWDGVLPALLNLLNPHRPFPDPNLIHEDPVAALNLQGQTHAAFRYRSGMTPRHEVGQGFMPVDRRMLTEQIAELLAPIIVLTDELPRLKHSRLSADSNPFFEREEYDDTRILTKSYLESETYAARRYLLGRATNQHVALEVRYQSGNLLEMFVNHISETFGLEQPVSLDTPHRWQTPELTLELTAKHLGSLGEQLEDSTKQGFQNRISKIRKEEQPAVHPTGTLIELAGENAFGRGRDPKDALRSGFGLTKRVTQFIGLEPEALEQRIKSSLLDLLRQLGVLPDLSKLQLDDLPEKINYLGLWVIKQGSQRLPILIHVSSHTNEVQGIAPGLTKWLTYRDLLAAIVRREASSFPYWEQPQIINFIQEKLGGDVIALGDTLLLCHAQNIRRIWPWLQDQRIIMDRIAFSEESSHPIKDPLWQGLRIIRVRSGENNETAQWYAQTEEQQGFSKGLFQIGERVFASTYQKPAQMRKLSPSLSKVKTVESATGKIYQPAPDSYAWNPAIYELTVACLQPGDNPAAWAALAHHLRNYSLQFNDPTALPLPLHLAKLVEEYTYL